MSETLPAPANLEDRYRLYVAALRETALANMFDAEVIRRDQTDVPTRWIWAFADRQPQP